VAQNQYGNITEEPAEPHLAPISASDHAHEKKQKEKRFLHPKKRRGVVFWDTQEGLPPTGVTPCHAYISFLKLLFLQCLKARLKQLMLW